MKIGLISVASGLLLLMFVWCWVGQLLLMTEMKRSDPHRWRSLASPLWLLALSKPAWRFVQGGGYRTVRSRRVRALGASLRVAQLGTVVLFLLLCVFYVVGNRWS